jgi:hypothetical protein
MRNKDDQPKVRESRDDPYDPFFIPPSILFGESVESSQNGCALLQLPPEILTMIFKQVNVPYFQVCLAGSNCGRRITK